MRRVLTLSIALLAAWRLPAVLALPQDLPSVAGSALTLVVAAGFWMLLSRGFNCRARRVNAVAYPLGFGYACFVVYGSLLERDGAFPPFAVGEALGRLLTVAIFTVLLGAFLAVCYTALMASCKRGEGCPQKPETAFSRLCGNGFAAFLLLLLCWAPVWLAFWPGTFRYDAPTQFETYIDGCLTQQHPLLHTLFLSRCLELGLGWDSMGAGLALYCGVQMALLAAMLGYACHWLWRRGVGLGARLCVLGFFALFPLFPLWSFSATKDVLFGGLVLVFVLQLINLWQEGGAGLCSPWRVAGFIASGVGMMLMRNNGVYAFALLLPFAILAAKGRRGRAALICACTVAVYLGCGWGLAAAVEAEGGSSVEMLSIPLQQVARVVTHNPDCLTPDEWAAVGELYADDVASIYDPQFADPIKWAMDDNAFYGDVGRYFSLWLNLGLRNPALYAEAFLVQNLPYYLPGAAMRYHIVLGCEQLEMYPIEEEALLPGLRAPYEAYERTLSGLPGMRLLSDTAFMVWVCLALAGLAIVRRRWADALACGFLLALWATNLLGPVAIMRYMLGFFYTVPVLAAHAFKKAPEKSFFAAREKQGIMETAKLRAK
ncbi:MAG: DUF6020 family protein [Clostridia bacterium]